MFTNLDISLIGRSCDETCVNQVIQLDHALDSSFGLNIDQLERSIHSQIENENENENESYYLGLNASALQTSYLDFYQIFQYIPENAVIVDVGSGYSRGTLLAQKLGRKCIGIEAVEQRVTACQKLLTHKEDIIHADITDENFCLPVGDYYFIYLPHGKVLYQTLKKIQKIATGRKVTLVVIESHGNVIEYLDAQDHWLVKRKETLTTSLPRHDTKIYFYDCYGQNYPTLVEQHWDWNSDKDKEYLIWQNNQLWTADTFGSELWFLNQKMMIETFAPNKMISLEDLFNTRIISNQSSDYRYLRQAREDKKRTSKGHICKIFIRPEPLVEWLNGETGSWQSAISELSSL